MEKIDSIKYGKGYFIEGLPFQKEENNFKDSILPIEGYYFDYYTQETNKELVSKKSQFEIDSININIKKERKKYLSKVLIFINANNHSYYSLFLFQKIILMPTNSIQIEREKLIRTFEMFGGDLIKTELWSDIQQLIILKQKLVNGSKAPDFYFKTKKLLKYSLNDLLKEKRVLLCFTAKRCGGCIMQIPIIKDIEQLMEGKDLQILYVSLDRIESDWKESLIKRAYAGIQTCDLDAYNFGIKIGELYNVEVIPQIYLIDKSGAIIYNYLLSRDDDNLAQLKKLLNP